MTQALMPTTETISPQRRSYNLVSVVAYLIGVQKEMFDREAFIPTVYETLDQNTNARTIRNLCLIRNALIKRQNVISKEMMYSLKNLDSLPQYIDPDGLKFLSSQGIQIIKANYKVNSYIIDLNNLISEHIGACQPLLPLWIKWEYIRKLFIMPNGTKEQGVTDTVNQFHTNSNQYPYQCYINVPASEDGNILYHDWKFATYLYKINHDEFTDISKVRDVKLDVRQALYQFIEDHEQIVLVVDCENSDPYKLCAVLRSIENYNSSGLDHIQKIILYDDPHTIDAWSILSNYVNATIEHEMVERVNEYKSLVDIRMTAGTCKEHYKNGINAFVLVSSDSDFWGLISALPTADFLLLVEFEKYGASLRTALESAYIQYCFMDHFTGNISDIKIAALKSEMTNYLSSCIQLNTHTMMDDLYSKMRIQMTEREKAAFYDSYVRSLQLRITKNGDCSIVIKE